MRPVRHASSVAGVQAWCSKRGTGSIAEAAQLWRLSMRVPCRHCGPAARCSGTLQRVNLMCRKQNSLHPHSHYIRTTPEHTGNSGRLRRPCWWPSATSGPARREACRSHQPSPHTRPPKTRTHTSKSYIAVIKSCRRKLERLHKPPAPPGQAAGSLTRAVPLPPTRARSAHASSMPGVGAAPHLRQPAPSLPNNATASLEPAYCELPVSHKQ